MNPDTGQFIDIDGVIAKHNLSEAEALRVAALELECEAEEMVLIRGNLQSVQKISDRVRLGAAEQERRAKRRKDQRASRRRNR